MLKASVATANGNRPKSHSQHRSNSINGLQTKLVLDEHQQVKIKVICQARPDAKRQVVLPLESIIGWYPLYFNYDYHYSIGKKDIILVIDKDAPRALKEQFGIENRPSASLATKYRLTDFVDFFTGQVKVEDNPILTANLALLNSLKHLDLTPINAISYSREQVSSNYAKINKVIDAIKETCRKAHQKTLTQSLVEEDGTINFPKAVDTEYQDIDLYRYLTDEDAQLLVELGGAYRMTELMDRILKAERTK